MSIILCNLSDANKIIDDERSRWVSEVLNALEIPDEVYDFKTIEEFRISMNEFGVDIILGTNGDVDIYKKQWHAGETEEKSGWLPITKDHLVAQWKEPERIRKVDGKGVYYEIHFKEWSILNMRKT
jgi:hypothetical protein